MIEIDNLSKSYPNNPIFKGVVSVLPDNRIHFLMGKNGSGKTTFIKCLLKLESYEGNILFSGMPLQMIRNEVFVIYDDIPLYQNLNGLQNINLMLEDRARYDIGAILGLGLLSEKKLKVKVKEYSLGERKKLALIAAILKRPQYLIIDEISNGLDVETLETLKACLGELSLHSLILATGHHFEFYENIVDELLVLHDCTITHIKDYGKGGEKLHEIYKKYISYG
jgi:ABC-type multidrug transport system ATPase subunit